MKFRSSLYSMMTEYFGMGRLNVLAAFALFDDDPGKVNSIEREIDSVTPELLQRTAREYLRKTNQTALSIVAKGGSL